MRPAPKFISQFRQLMDGTSATLVELLTSAQSVLVLNVLLNIAILANVLRIVLTWYPQAPVTKLPYNLVYSPTEPLLGQIRKVIPPFAGIDMAPVVAVGFFSLVRELLLGQQGLLILWQS
jgi:YggT family protein